MVIDAMMSDCIEQELRAAPDGGILIRNWDDYYEGDGKFSIFNNRDDRIYLLRQLVSRAGLKVLDFSHDYNMIALTVEKRKAADLDGMRKVSVVMSSYGSPGIVQQAVESIWAHTTIPFELIVCNNPCPDAEESKQTARILNKLAEEGKIDKYIQNEKNLGDMGALNRGMLEASGGHLCVVNNDIIATAGWLRALVECAEQERDALIVSSRTNNIAGYQKVGNAPSNEIVKANESILHTFAANWGEKNRLGWWKAVRIRSMTMLMRDDFKRPLDMLYGMGNYDDDDMCCQAMEAGGNVYVADESYVHHWGSTSFLKDPEGFRESMRVNRKKFTEKWSHNPELAELMLSQDVARQGTKQDAMVWHAQ